MSETVLAALLRQAYLFDDPGAYAAGVRDAWAAVEAALEAGPQPVLTPGREGAAA